MKEMKYAKFTPFNADIVIHSQEQLAHYPKIQIIELPGHTLGSIGIIFDGNLFVGDLLMNLPIPSKSWFAEDFDMLTNSIETIKSLKIQRIYPGHGTSFSAKWLKLV